MTQFRNYLIIPLAWLVMACSQAATVEMIDGADITVVATELSDDAWRIDYHFSEPQSALIFARSKGDYRTTSWTPLGDAPAVERVDSFDAVIFETPMAQFSYEIAPHSESLPQDYTPFLGFSDGGRAMYTGQFELLKVTDRNEIEALDGDLNVWQGNQPNLGVRVISDRPMLVQGKQVKGTVEHVSKGGGTYIYVGESDLYQGDSYIGVIDSALPAHITETLDADLSALFKIYDQKWGFSLPSKGTIYYAFSGYTHPGYSNSGSVLGTDLMVLQSSGEALREPDPDNRLRNLWFFAHEGAHMYQSHLMLQFHVGPDAWIHEGGANTMANSAIQELPDVPETFILGEYQTAFEQCAADLQRGSLQTAHVDGRFYAHYHCGQLFNAAAASALPEHDLYGLWSAFTANLDAEKPDVAETFYATMLELGADPDVPSAIKALANEQSEDPAADLSTLLELSGMAPEFDTDGTLVSLQVPN